MTNTIPAWLATEIQLRNDKCRLVRSETVEDLHARILRDRGERWDAKTQRWVKA